MIPTDPRKPGGQLLGMLIVLLACAYVVRAIYMIIRPALPFVFGLAVIITAVRLLWAWRRHY